MTRSFKSDEARVPRRPARLLHRTILAVLLGALLAVLASPAVAQPQGTGLAGSSAPLEHGLGFEARPFPVQAIPPLPDPDVFPIQLVLDDDQADGVFGFASASARQFLWFQQFDSPGPFVLQEVWVLFPAEMDVPLGGDVQLVVYRDPDGDPTNGAELLAAWDGVIQAADGDTFSIYPLPAELQMLDPGDVLIGVVSRFFDTGSDPPPTRPAALDTTASQGRSWFALWAGDPPPSPDLAGALVVDLLDGAVSGNWMIRGFGVPPPVTAIPTLGHLGLVLLALLLGGAAVRRLRR